MPFDGHPDHENEPCEGISQRAGNLHDDPPQLNDIRVPEPLRALPHWLVWRRESFPGEERLRKVPYYADGARRHGRQGSLHDLEQLVTFDEARDAALRHGFDGIGLAHVHGANVITLDFDNCVVDGVVRPDVLALVRGTYAEYSPSGKGIHATFFGQPDLVANYKHKATDGGFSVEAFSSRGFVTFTGLPLDHVDLLHGLDYVAPMPDYVVKACHERFGKGREQRAVDPDDFLVGREPALGLSVPEIEKILGHLDPGMGREPWIRVGMALHHETQGDDTGLALWDEWSSRGHNYRGSEDVRYQWESFKQVPGRPSVTMASVIHMAKEQGYEARKTFHSEEGLARAESIRADAYRCRNPREIPPRLWLYGYQLLRGTVACLVANGGTGKSTWLAGIALATVTGRPLLGKQIWGGPQRVWLWNLEDDLDELSRSIEAARLQHGIGEDDIGGRLFVNSGMDGASLTTAVKTKEGIALHQPVYDAIKAEIERLGIALLCIDPFVSSHNVEENANMEIDHVVKAWARVAKDTGCCILLSHHTSKAGSQEVTGTSARGASALTAAARSVLVMNQMTISEAEQLGVERDLRKRFVKVGDDKHNRAPVEKEDWFQLKSVCLGNGTEGRPSDNIGVLAQWQPPASRSLHLSNQTIFEIQQIAKDGSYRRDQQAHDWFGFPLAKVLETGSYQPHEKRELARIIQKLIEDGYLAIESRPNQRKQLSPYIVAGPKIVSIEDAAT